MALKLLYWIPRLFGIAAILFVSMFSLDAFGHGNPVGEQIKDFLMHNIPSYILIVILIIAWKWEMVGGILFIILGIAVMPWLWQHNFAMNQSYLMTSVVLLTIAFPFVVVGVLFILHHVFSRKK